MMAIIKTLEALDKERVYVMKGNKQLEGVLVHTNISFALEGVEDSGFQPEHVKSIDIRGRTTITLKR